MFEEITKSIGVCLGFLCGISLLGAILISLATAEFADDDMVEYGEVTKHTKAKIKKSVIFMGLACFLLTLPMIYVLEFGPGDKLVTTSTIWDFAARTIFSILFISPILLSFKKISKSFRDNPIGFCFSVMIFGFLTIFPWIARKGNFWLTWKIGIAGLFVCLIVHSKFRKASSFF